MKNNNLFLGTSQYFMGKNEIGIEINSRFGIIYMFTSGTNYFLISNEDKKGIHVGGDI